MLPDHGELQGDAAQQLPRFLEGGPLAHGAKSENGEEEDSAQSCHKGPRMLLRGSVPQEIQVYGVSGLDYELG